LPQHRHPPTWMRSNRPLARIVAQPVARFLQIEASAGLLLVAAAVIALVWASSPWSAAYHQLWGTDVALEAGPFHLSGSLVHWVNDALMAVFFFVVGLEISRELTIGHLADRRAAALPVLAAVGGTVVPAAIYLAVTAGGDGTEGWGIPMATDIAFAVGVVMLLGDRVPAAVRLLLLAVAIVDDIAAISVIAIFYTDDLEVAWLAGALLGVAVVALMRRVRVWYLPVYLLAGVGVWLCLYESGVHPTLAGVAMGFLTPVRPLVPEPELGAVARRLSADEDVTVDEVRELAFELRESVSVSERFEEALHPWSSYVILPLFALANAGVSLSASSVGDALSSRVTIGIVLGLVIGKPLGILGASWLAVRTGVARLPAGLSWRHIAGLGTVAGIGFTVAIFVSGLAFDRAEVQDEARLGVLAASVVAAVLGGAVLRRAPGR
jgi:NhaA family Na+:H+ antiporter